VVAKNWVSKATGNLTRFYGLEHLRGLDADRGVFVIANHRSFFDFYTISATLLREVPSIERMYFPVRASFFYESALGSVVNGLMSAWAMYPPVMRDGPKRAFNDYSVGFLEDALTQRGTFVGFHPKAPAGGARIRTNSCPRTSAPGASCTARARWSCRCSPSGSSTAFRGR
jgi:1-acyl-sn-glycerol-3-phosphate acyltransferase